MDILKCKAFITAADEGSFTAAGKIMGYTPSGISQLVAAMEKEFGFSLLMRKSNGVVLTREGEYIYPFVMEYIEKEAAVYKAATELSGMYKGNVMIAAYSSIATHWLPAVIKEFQKQYPGIEIHLHEGIRQEVEELLASRKADMAFMSYKEPMAFEWIPLAEDPMLAVLDKEHPFAKRKKYPLKACEQEVFIMPAQGLDEDVTNMIRENNLTLQIGFQTHENFSAIAMIEQGLGMSIMNKLITDRLDYDVIKIPVDPPQHITFGVAIPALDHATPAARKFVEMAVAMLKTNYSHDQQPLLQQRHTDSPVSLRR